MATTAGINQMSVPATDTSNRLIFILPAGIADGLLSGRAMILLLMARYGKTPIVALSASEREFQ